MQFRKVKELVSQTLIVADMTDAAATGTIDFDSALPAGAIPLGWQAVVSGAFAGDTSAVISVGIEGDLDKYSANTAQSVFTTGTVASLAIAADAATGMASAQTPRVTVTSAADFTDVVTDGNGEMVVTIYYIDT